MSTGLDKDNKHFNVFYLDNTAIYELPENTFEDITFDSIKILDAKNLSLIHTLAFSASNLHLKRFFVSNSSINNSPPNHDIFTAISSMVGLEYLFIINSLIDEIPENAFRLLKDQQKNLSEINLFSNKIRKIGKNAFQDLISLEVLDLHNNTIDHISEKSFNFRESSEKITRMFLNGCLLNSSSFEIGSFDSLNRPTELSLNLFDQINYVTYFDQRIFESFLEKNKNNQIISKALDCNDCRSFWLHKNEKYHPQIADSACNDGKKFLDKDNFAKCAEY
jgi:Leucine-rich repeat (LRR) protein